MDSLLPAPETPARLTVTSGAERAGGLISAERAGGLISAERAGGSIPAERAGGLTPAERARLAAIIRSGSRSFHAASLVLPARIREPALSLYAFCRMSDDLIDGAGAGTAALSRLRLRLERIYRGAPEPWLADRAFAEVVAQTGIPRGLPEALIEGFEWDIAGRRYATFPALLDYAARVAGTVGVMMAMVMGVRGPAALARAGELGLAMQLTNIARDIGEDAANGRLYLPEDWMRAEGLDPDGFMARPQHSPALARLTARLLAEAQALYRRAETGIAALPGGCRPAIRAAARIYAAIGGEIAAAGYDPVAGRARTTAARKVRLLAGAALARQAPCDPAPAAEPVRFLVEMACAVSGPAHDPAYDPAHDPAMSAFTRRVLRIAELMAAAELRARRSQQSPSSVGVVEPCTGTTR